MVNRKLRAWARAYFAALADDGERTTQERLLVVAIGICIGALAVVIVSMVVYWPA